MNDATTTPGQSARIDHCAQDPDPRQTNAAGGDSAALGEQIKSATNRLGNSITSPPISGYRWRKARGLLTIGDHVRLYRAVRYPRGSYRVPLPGDLIDRRGGRYA